MSTATLTRPTHHPSIEYKVDELICDERCTIVHVQYYGYGPIRVWATTYLVQENGERKKLLQAYNITLYPKWKEVSYGHKFTLLFEGLDKECFKFDLFEDIPEPGGFYIQDIKRNDQDVYWLSLDEED